MAIILADPGFGKTKALAAAVYGLVKSVNQVFMSAPTHAACDYAVDRLMELSKDVTSRVNRIITPCHRLLVVRAYNPEEELAALMSILRCPESIKDAAPTPTSKWQLKNSLAFWVLSALGSAVVPQLGPDDCTKLHSVKRELEEDKRLVNLLGLARMEMSWDNYVEKAETLPVGRLKMMMRYVLGKADVVCSTPAESTKEPYVSWKRQSARGFAIDDASRMSRPDFYSVWGNTMMPCVMAGDSLQLGAEVLSFDDEVSRGVYRNRHGPDAKISILEFLQASGWPVFRMLTPVPLE
ncbi:unnamed protein product [Clonostachys rosea]|uniref:DNA2/NAM7 helicase helicase domain-containing protein n=1 Tax=Bionectria ochroleuca TaxID=29856 RepID=A0ABY6UZI8_BIOOC|nr:unnamed protein product [Clonostachys rosea]